MEAKKAKKIYLIDGNSLCYRAYYAIQELSTSKGMPTNAIYGFVNMLRKLIREYEPDIIIRASNKQTPHTNYVHALAEAHPIPNMTTADDPEHRGWGELMPVYTSENGKLKVFAFLVDHYPCFPSYGYRVEYAGRSVVISGDTEKCTYMAKCATGADMLVQECVNKEITALICGIMEDRFGDSETAAHLMRALEHHNGMLDVARIAEDAGVAKLVLTHLMIPTPFRVMEKRLTKGMDEIYHGEIIVGRDGLDIYLEPKPKG